MSAQVTITSLPQAGAITGTESVPIVQNGVTVQTTTGAIAGSPSQTQTFITLNQEPTLTNSRYLGATNGLTLSASSPQGVLNVTTTGALSSLVSSGTGLQVKTNSTTLAGRTITVSGSGLSISDGDGIAGNPTVSLTNPLATIATNGFVPIAYGGTGQTTANAAFNALSPITSTGDLIIGNGSNSATRLAIGTNNYVLTSNGTTATWSQVSASAFTGVLPVANGGTNRSVGNYSVYDNEIHVGKNGNDTTGDGTLINPVLTITKALTLIGSGKNTVIVHPGGYTENPTVSSANTTIATSELTGANTIVYGTLTLSAAARVSGLKMTNLTITGSGNTYISNCTVDTQVVKSGTNYVEIINSELQCVSGIQISGSGAVSIVGNKCWAVAVSNASASVLIKDCYQVITPSVSAGTLQIDGSAIFAASPTSNAVTSSAGTAITLANSFVLNSAGTNVERVSLAGNYSILNLVYDKTNSTFAGTSLNAIDYFQYVNADRINFNGSTSGITGLIASAVAGTNSLTLPAVTDTLVARTTTDTLTNKTLTSPVISTIVNTGTLTLPTSTDTLVGRATTDTLTNKTLTSPVISTIVNTGTLTLPTSTDTLVGRDTTDTLTNKTLTNPTITNYTETRYAATVTGNAITLTLTNGTFQTITTMAGANAITLPAVASGKSLTVQVLYASTPTTLTFAAPSGSLKYPAGTTPTPTLTNTKYDFYSFISDGTNWYGVQTGANF